MRIMTLSCDKCGKGTSMLYDCCMHFEKYDGVNLEDPRTTHCIELCKDCLEEYKSMFNKKKTAPGKERPEAEA